MTLPELLSSHRLTQTEFAARAGITKQRVNAWTSWYDGQQSSSARDPKRMSVDMAARCADALGITLDEFHRSL